MAIRVGRNARFKRNSTVVGKMTSWNLTQNNEFLETDFFGNQWKKGKRGIQAWTATVSGIIDLDDSEQEAFLDDLEAGNEITDVEFFIDATNYYKVDIVTDTEAMCIAESFTITAENAGLVSFECSLVGSGPILRTTT